MEQLTCLKRTLRSPAAGTAPQERPTEAPLGVPAHPGEGALDTNPIPRRGGRTRAPRPRADLGTVDAPPPASPAARASPLGSLSLLFGRKGGLL